MGSTDINRVTLIGRATRDPELRYTQGGQAVTSLDIASNKAWTQNGEKKEQVSFFSCVAWGKLAETVSAYVHKGERIGIEGRLQQRSFTDKNGNKRSVVEIIVENIQFLQAHPGTGDNSHSGSQDDSTPRVATEDEKYENQSNCFSDEDIPF